MKCFSLQQPARKKVSFLVKMTRKKYDEKCHVINNIKNNIKCQDEKKITHLKFSTLGRRYFGRSFLQLHLQCITQSPIEAMMLTINGTMKKWIIVVT